MLAKQNIRDNRRYLVLYLAETARYDFNNKTFNV